MSKAYVLNGVYYEGGADKNRPAEYARKFERDHMRVAHRKDLIQKWNGDKPNPDFIKAYPDKAREVFSEEDIRKLG